jgi:hypothetical protein
MTKIKKRRIFSGCVCEQEVYTVTGESLYKKKERFETEYDRAEHREGISRRHHARLVNTNFTPLSLYSTLTMDDAHEVHTFDEARQVASRYMRRLKYTAPNAKIMLYMGRGESTERIHFHMISDGINAETIKEKWTAGHVVRVNNLKKTNYSKNGDDIGQDYTGLASYLFRHWTQEQGGKRWKQTRNIEQPYKEKETVTKRKYSETRPPRPPKGYKYTGYTNTQFGYQCFRYVHVKDSNENQHRRC